MAIIKAPHMSLLFRKQTNEKINKNIPRIFPIIMKGVLTNIRV